jgi:hypothetical protein
VRMGLWFGGGEAKTHQPHFDISQRVRRSQSPVGPRCWTERGLRSALREEVP